MKIENNTEASETESTVATENEAQPRKLLLGKRVLRHFNVRSSLQTGKSTDSADSDSVYPESVRQRCFGP